MSKFEDRFGGNVRAYSYFNTEGGAAADVDSREYGEHGVEGDCAGVMQLDEQVQAPAPSLLSLYLHPGGRHVHIHYPLTPRPRGTHVPKLHHNVEATAPGATCISLLPVFLVGILM